MIQAYRTRFPKTSSDYELKLARLEKESPRPDNETLRLVAGRAIYITANELIGTVHDLPTRVNTPRRHIKGHRLAIDEKQGVAELAYTTERGLSDRFHKYTALFCHKEPTLSYQWHSINEDCQVMPSQGKIDHDELLAEDAAIDGLLQCAAAFAQYAQHCRLMR